MEKMKITSPERPFNVMKSLLISGIALLVCQSVVFAQGISYEQVAFEGDELDDGGAFAIFTTAVINSGGMIAFQATSGQLASCSNDTTALWKSAEGVLQPPVCNEAVVIDARLTILNDSGDLAFVPFRAIDSEAGGRHRVVSGDTPVPGLPDERFNGYFPPA
jgi:hypothetical protein